jgi:hypothetical protein
VTSMTDGFTQLGATVSSPATNLGLFGSPTAAPAAQVAAEPGAAPEVEAPYGDAGDWARWTAVATATTLAGYKLNTEVTPAVADAVRQKYAAVKSGAPLNSTTLSNIKNATAGPRSVISKTAGALVNKGAARVPGGRSVVKASTWAGRAVATRMGPAAAGMLTRVGLRMAVFAIPGPGWVLGAVMLAGTWLFDDSMRRVFNNLTGKLFGVNNSPALDAPPEPPRTFFLPLTHDGDRDSVIDTKDKEMVVLNDAAFAFDPDKVWHPTAPVIETTPTFEQSTLAFQELAKRAIAEREALESTLRKYRGEQAVDRVAESLKSTVASLDTFGATIMPAVTQLVSDHAVATNNLYLELRDANNASRQEIANSGAGLLPWTSDVDASKMGQLENSYTTYVTDQDKRNSAVEKAFADWTPPQSGSSTGRLSGIDIPGANGGGAYTPRPGAQPVLPKSPSDPVPIKTNPPGEKSGPSKDDVLGALRDMGASATPSPNATDPFKQAGMGMQNPFGAGMQNPFAAGMGMQNPFGQTGMGAGLNPAATQPTNTAGKTDPAKLESKLRDLLNRGQNSKDAKDTVAENEANKTEVPAEEAGAPEVVAAPAPGPAQPAQPVSAEEIVSTALGVDSPAKGAQPDPATSKTAEVAGRIIEFEDPKSARMAEIMQPKDGSAPPTVQEAAAEAGFTLPPAGQPIGEVVPTADLRPGDLIMGDDNRNGLYLGDGKVLTGGEVRSVADVANFTGDGHGIFRLDEATPPVSDDAVLAAAEGSSEGKSDGAPEAPTDPAAPTGDTPAPGEAETDTVTVTQESDTADEPAVGVDPPASGMPLPRATIPTSDTASGTPVSPTVPVGD